MNNPFANKLPLDINNLSSRQETISRIAENVQSGISSLIINEPKMGVHSLIAHLMSAQNREQLYKSSDKTLLLCYVNSQSLSAPINELDFWKSALKSLCEDNLVEDVSVFETLIQKIARKDYDLSDLTWDLKSITKKGYKLAILISEFDYLVNELETNGHYFCNKLRAFINEDIIMLIAFSNHPTTDFRNVFLSTSPLFNLLYPIRLTGLSNRDIASILNIEGSRFTSSDRLFITSVAGGHPYLLRVAASAVWDESLGNKELSTRYINAGKRIYDETKTHFTEIWKLWTPEKRKAATSIAILQTPHILENHSFSANDFIDELPNLRPELHELETFGTLVPDKSISGGYKLTQGAMLWWLVDELIRTMRDEQSFRDWIFEKELLGGVVKKKELDLLQSFASRLGGLLHEGALSLIKAYAESVIK